jgi:hypothetical protein
VTFPFDHAVLHFILSLKSALIAYHHVNHALWDSDSHWLQFAFNTACHESLGCTPVSLMFAFSPNNPLSNIWTLSQLLPNRPDPAALRDVWNRARHNLRRSHERVHWYYDSKRQPCPYSIGQKVMIRNYPQSRVAHSFSDKLAPRYRGLYTVAEFTTPVSVKLLNSADYAYIRAHLSQLKSV